VIVKLLFYTGPLKIFILQPLWSVHFIDPAGWKIKVFNGSGFFTPLKHQVRVRSSTPPVSTGATLSFISLANKKPILYAWGMEPGMHGPVGIIADSHGRNELLLQAILMLKGMDVQTIFHLGDICDSLAPLALEDAVGILKEHGVRPVMGNNEYAIMVNHRGRHANSLSPEILSFLSGLPYTITIDDFCFAHSAPFDWPAATSWPITDSHPFIDLGSLVPYQVLFRGHSHTPSIMEIDGTIIKKIPAEAGMKKRLFRNRRYVITVGAVEEASLALFLPDEYEIQFLQLGRR
jgi:predicted phosphodiesterase